MNLLNNYMSKRTPYDLSVSNQETIQSLKGGISPLRTCARIFSKKYMLDHRDQVSVDYNLISRWEHTLHLQVTGQIKFQLIFPLMALGNLLRKPQYNLHLLIHCKYHVIQVSESTYLTPMIMQYVCTSETHHTPLEWLVQPTTVARPTKLSLKLMDFPLVLIISVLFPCRIPSRTLWGLLEKDGTLSTDFRVQRYKRFMREPSPGPLMIIMVILIR